MAVHLASAWESRSSLVRALLESVIDTRADLEA